MNNPLASLVLLTSLSLARTAYPEAPSISSHFRRVVVDSGQTVGEVACTGCSIEIRGAAQGDVITFGGDILLTGSAGGDVIALGGSVHLLPRAVVGGDAVAIAGSVEKDAESRISGDVDSIPYLHLPGQRGFQSKGVFTFLAVNLALVILTALLLRSERAWKISAVLSECPLRTFATGLAALLAGSLLIILPGLAHSWALVLTGVAALAMLVLFLPGYAGVNLAVGSFLTRRRSWIAALLAGVLLTTGLQLIPVAGFFVMIIVLVSALGCSLLSRLGMISSARVEPPGAGPK